jgi:hypothetical protein
MHKNDAVAVDVAVVVFFHHSVRPAYTNTMDANKKKKNKEEMEFVLAMGMVAYTVVKQFDCKKKRDDRKKKMNRARPNMRGPRAIYPHQRALDAIYTNFLDQAALYGPTFQSYFRLSRPRVQLLMEVLAGSGDQYYVPTVRFGVTGPSLEARILLPLRTLAYGVADHIFCPCFSMAPTTARVSCRKFNEAMTQYFGGEFLRLPTPSDLKSISELHLQVHGVPGMLGSLDCMHTYWKNCPVAWQGSFQGKAKGQSTIILEAVADHCLWFWHASYGYSGALNDLNVLTLSPLMRRITDGSFTQTEAESGVVPFDIGTSQSFLKMFMLVDGIYPSYSRFIRGFKEPVTTEESTFTSWQEGARKDVERAFGVFQAKWKSVATPIQTIDPKYIASMVSCCLILHNMGVSDRVMGDVHTRYDPGSVVLEEVEGEDEESIAAATAGIPAGERSVVVGPAATTTIRAFDVELAKVITQRDEMRGLANEAECVRLQRALISYVSSWND